MITIRFIVTILLLSISAFAKDIQPNATIDVKATPVQILELYDSYQYPALCRAAPSKDYYAQQISSSYSQVSGRIDFITNQQGAKVKKGDVLMTIESNYAEQYKNQASIALRNKQNILDDTVKLYAKGVVSQMALDTAKLDFAKAQSDLEAMKMQYRNAIITSDFDGYLGPIQHQLGDMIKQGDYLFSVVHENDKEFDIELPESLIGKINYDTQVMIKTDDNSKSLEAKINYIAQYLNPSSNNFSVKAIMTTKNDLLHNSVVFAQLIVNKHKALVVPESVVLQNETGAFVYLISEDKAKQVYVKTASRLNNFIEISGDNISEGSVVVSQGLNKLYDGATIKVIEN